MPHSTDVNGSFDPTKTKLFVNDGLLNPSEVSFLRPSEPGQPLEELRKRYHEDGYLFIKALIPRADVLQARSQYFDLLSPSGVLKPGTTAVEGIYDSEKDTALFPGIGSGAAGGNGHPGEHAARFVDLALKAHGEPWYADFCKHPKLLEFVAKFTGWAEHTLPFRRTLLRNNIPTTQAIGVHYDQIFLRYGEPTSVTAWVPMGDISLTGGGSELGQSFEKEFTDKAKASGMTEEEAKSAFNQNMMSTGLLSGGPAEFGRSHQRRWLVTNFDAGDVVLHSPYTIHASTVNHDPNNIIRLATDIRFVDSSRPWDKVSLNT
ncbi:hypothetical protein D0Z07_6076 [Hyphodiscus hymeniophilus]|uniref:Phytanoyl-CoA hydroxylase n=1 Tax=Hyphodiscus hymeniophilus TaxID=353542 RepID=A0A9P6VH16_9HELO|nr:hypothetical protein D0Z07_6076 [Hyphodiscus hymeniophilus]